MNFRLSSRSIWLSVASDVNARLILRGIALGFDDMDILNMEEGF